MKHIIKIFFISMLLALLTVPICSFAEETSFDELSQATNVACDKEWTVKFAAELKSETINSDNIKVYKGINITSNTQVPVSIKPGTNPNEIIVGTPASGYVPGRTYSLVIGKDVQALSGSKLSKPARMKFVIKGSYDNGSSYSDYPQITSLSFGYVPLLQSQKQDFYLTSSGGQVQYRVFIHKYTYGLKEYDFTEVTNGYTEAVSGNASYKVTAPKLFDSKAEGQKYKVIVYVKRANTSGAHTTSIAGIQNMDYDNFYVDYFRAVNDKATVNGNMNTQYPMQQALDKQMAVSPKTDEGDDSSAWVNSNSNMVKYYLNPQNFMDSYGKNLFLRLDSYVNDISADSINNVLKGAGALDGKGQAFLDAAKKYDINPAYLVSHALHETGNGTSQLSKGVIVDGKTVYNFFGIKAVDTNVVGGGSAAACSSGWYTPEAAITGGAEYVANNYIKNTTLNQNTLYKMRWNPMNPGTHEYATNISWQVVILAKMNALLSNSKAELKYEVPVYSK